MSRPRARRAATLPSLSVLVGHRWTGGCDDCDAYQSMTRDPHGIYHLTVHHDDTCPWLAGVTR